MTTALSHAATGFAPALRRLYLVRSGFAIVWAVLLVLTGPALGPVTAVLVVLYPVVDAVAAAADARADRGVTSPRGPYLTIATSSLAAIGLAIALTSGVPAVLRVWGAWAVVAGLVQLAVAVTRRAMGGQWPMVLSGVLSVLAGASFAFMAGRPGPSLVGFAGYAALGGLFFLVSALRLGRAARTTTPEQ